MDKTRLVPKTYHFDGPPESAVDEEKEKESTMNMSPSAGNSKEERDAKFDFMGNELAEAGTIPYVAVYDDKKAWRQRGCFIPIFGVDATISEVERNRNRGLSKYWNPFIYTINVKHGPHDWSIQRDYTDFKKLANSLKRSRAINRVTAPFHRSGAHTLRYSGPGLVVDKNTPDHGEGIRSNPPDHIDQPIDHKRRLALDSIDDNHELSDNENDDIKDDQKPINPLSLFPIVPDYAVKKDSIERRREKLQNFLSETLKIREYQDHPAMARFLGVNRLSFIGELGPKGKEELVKRRGVGCFTYGNMKHCCIMDFFSRRETWLSVKDSYMVCLDPVKGYIREVILFDRDFSVEHYKYPSSLQITGSTKFVISNKQRKLRFKCRSSSSSSSWIRHIESAMSNRFASWCQVQRFGSTYPIRQQVFAQWLVDGEDFMRYAADMIEMAKEEIFIASWCLHAQIFMKRDPWDDQSRFDLILKRKAEQGVKIFLLLFREIQQVLSGTDSFETKKYLESLHPNIKALRHPHPLIDLKLCWTNHEKIVMVDQKIALLAGIDFCFGRWDNAEHRLIDVGKTNSDLKPEPIESTGPLKKTPDLLDVKGRLWPGKDYISCLTTDVTKSEVPFVDLVDRSTTPRTPWHDMGCAVFGSVARDVARHFIQRWNGAKIELAHSKNEYPFLLPKSYENVPIPDLFRKTTIPCNAQLLRSSCEWASSHQYTEESIHRAYLELINGAEHFVYMENPFFVSKGNDENVKNEVAEAIYKRIVRAHENKETFRVYIIVPFILGYVKNSHTMLMEMYYHYATISHGENSLLRRLERAVGDPSRYISFCSMMTWAELEGRLVCEMIYVHNKLLIVDDRWALLGSANIDDRSLLGDRDSEIGVLVEDVDFTQSTMNGEPFQSGKFAGSLRRRLCREHLGLLDKCAIKAREEINVDDLLHSDFYDRWNGIAKKNFEIYEKVFSMSPNNDIMTLEEWERRDKEVVRLADTDKAESLNLLQNVEGYLVSFPTEFLSGTNMLTEKPIAEAMLPAFMYT